MDIAPDGMGLVLKNDSDPVLHLGEIFTWINPYESTRRAVFLARISMCTRTRGIEIGVITKVALDRNEVVNLGHRLRRSLWSNIEPVPDFAGPLRWRRRRRSLAWHHGDGIVGTLCGAVTTANTSFRLDINLPSAKTANRAGRTTGQAFRVLAVHTNRR